ncbi:MAG: CPBP family intramembrane glutamic endopeptidase [Acidobacteriota bacterium]
MEITEQIPLELDAYAMESLKAQPTPNDPPWNGWIALLVWLMSVLLVVVVPSVVVLAYVAPLRNQFSGQEALIEFVKSDPTAVVLQVVAIIPVHLLTILLAWAVVTRMRTYPFRSTLGWNSGGMRWWHYVLILVGIFALSAVVMGYYPEADNDLLRIVRSSRAAVFVIAALATFTAPLVEEVVYRGILYSAFQRAFGVVIAVGVVTALFALVHFPQYWPSYSTLFLLTLLSLILTMVRVRTGNLLPCIILHTVFNGLQSVALIAEPYFSTPAIDPSHVTTAAFLFSFIK